MTKVLVDGREMGLKNHVSIEIFECKFENFLKNCKFFIGYFKFLKGFEYGKCYIFDFPNVKSKTPLLEVLPSPLLQRNSV